MKKSLLLKVVVCLAMLAAVIPAKAQCDYSLQADLLKISADGRTLCTQQLQQAIDAIYKKGGGRLVLTKGTYLTGGLMLRSKVEVNLEEGATLLGSTNPYDYQSVMEDIPCF